MPMKEYYTFPKDPGLKPHHQIEFSVISRALVWLIDETLKGTTTLRQCGPKSNGLERVFHFLPSSETGASPSDGLVPYLGHSLMLGVTPSTEMQSTYSTASVDWARWILCPCQIFYEKDRKIMHIFRVCHYQFILEFLLWYIKFATLCFHEKSFSKCIWICEEWSPIFSLFPSIFSFIFISENHKNPSSDIIRDILKIYWMT